MNPASVSSDAAPAVFVAWRDMEIDGCLKPDQDARIIRSDSATRLRIVLMHLAALRARRPKPVFDEQIEHLMRATGAEHFRFGVIPDFAVTGIELASDFWLYDDAVVEIGTVAGEVRSTAREDVELCGRVFEAFAGSACYGQAARDLLAAFAAEAAAAGRVPTASPTTRSEH